MGSFQGTEENLRLASIKAERLSKFAIAQAQLVYGEYDMQWLPEACTQVITHLLVGWEMAESRSGLSTYMWLVPGTIQTQSLSAMEGSAVGFLLGLSVLNKIEGPGARYGGLGVIVLISDEVLDNSEREEAAERDLEKLDDLDLTLELAGGID